MPSSPILSPPPTFCVGVYVNTHTNVTVHHSPPAHSDLWVCTPTPPSRCHTPIPSFLTCDDYAYTTLTNSYSPPYLSDLWVYMPTHQKPKGITHTKISTPTAKNKSNIRHFVHLSVHMTRAYSML